MDTTPKGVRRVGVHPHASGRCHFFDLICAWRRCLLFARVPVFGPAGVVERRVKELSRAGLPGTHGRMPKDNHVVTLRMLLDHLQAGFESLRTDLQSELRRETEPLRKAVAQVQADVAQLKGDVGQLKANFAQLQENDEKTHLALQRLYERRIETVEKVEDHQERITAIEDVELPLVKATAGIT